MVTPIAWDVRQDTTDPTRVLLQFDDAEPIALHPTAVLLLMNALTSQMLRCLQAECDRYEATR